MLAGSGFLPIFGTASLKVVQFMAEGSYFCRAFLKKICRTDEGMTEVKFAADIFHKKIKVSSCKKKIIVLNGSF